MRLASIDVGGEPVAGGGGKVGERDECPNEVGEVTRR